MSTTTKAESSRANGARSRGPKTDEGKRRSSLNAVTHGLLASGVVLQHESQATFDQILAHHLAKLAPADEVEVSAIQEMVANIWRLRRVWAIETRLIDNGVNNRPKGDDLDRVTATFSELAAGPELNLINRYETRLHRMYQRSFNNLMLFRALPRAEKLGLPNEPETRP